MTPHEIRRAALRHFIQTKFDSNRSAFARAAGVHQNQINLILSDNLVHQRNLGETLARKMEAALGIPTGFFDTVQAAGDEATVDVTAWVVPEALLRIVGRDDVLLKVTLKRGFINRLEGKFTDTANLRTCRVSTHDMDPEVAFGEHVIVDMGVQGVTADGVYILGRGSDLFLRRVTKSITGGWLKARLAGRIAAI